MDAQSALHNFNTNESTEETDEVIAPSDEIQSSTKQSIMDVLNVPRLSEPVSGKKGKKCLS